MGERLGELFDPTSELLVAEHFRPHWSQAGAIVFITFRTADSIPKDVLLRWELEKVDWLQRHGFADDQHWSKTLQLLDVRQRHDFTKHFNRCREVFLDSCHGECVFYQQTLAKIVADALMHFDGDRYRLGDFVVMPNHVHLLAAFPSEQALVMQCDSWLHYTARQLNLQLGRTGKFWQQEPFDHLVRSPQQYEYLREYIQKNGVKAGLKEGEYFYRRYEG